MKPRSKDQGYRLERRRRDMRRRARAIAVLGPRPGHPHHRALWDVLVRAAGAGHFRPWLEPEMFTPRACGWRVKVVPIEVEVRCDPDALGALPTERALASRLTIDAEVWLSADLYCERITSRAIVHTNGWRVYAADIEPGAWVGC